MLGVGCGGTGQDDCSDVGLSLGPGHDVGEDPLIVHYSVLPDHPLTLTLRQGLE
ncbi:hypothetical protein B840_12610 (plasmid) [Corynebacterium marinum DSM 44953]|uniref:Uncharacterized protein n=1 Tax=Corynebacterium marinum DSM 44953 TaxID=1224162 RepID=A0A0B6TWX3_9CORY|nr:hypothetical protein B840_12610 [Corynebacterium marinum DSM 44953]